MELEKQAEIIHRLRCAAGHLNAVIEMAESGQPCEYVLHQLNAVQSALSAVGLKIIHCQAQSSQDIIMNSASFNRRVAELKRIQSLYTIFVQHFNHTPEVYHD
jgi:DNA-binding FrmR family transcriptional regulator